MNSMLSGWNPTFSGSVQTSFAESLTSQMAVSEDVVYPQMATSKKS